MGKESDDLSKRLFGSNDQPIFGLTDNPSGLNGLRRLSDLGRLSPPRPIPAPANNLLNLLGQAGLGEPIVPPIPRPAPPAPAKPDMNWIRHFAGAMAQKRGFVKDGRVMPSIDDLAVMEGRRVNAAFVYSDLHGFTKLVAMQPENKSFVFLHTFVEIASRLTKHYGGQVIDCAGDRVLSVFHRSPGDISDDPIHDAVTFGLYMQTAFDRGIGPAFATGFGQQLSLGIGIDYGPAVVGCVGIREGKRLVFFGDAANKAVKLQEMAGVCETVLSHEVANRKPRYLESSNGWNLVWDTTSDGSWALRTNCVFREDELVKIR
jgi:class 3 adenylate cyclase